MNPSERFHPSLLGFCVDKRQEGWKSCHIAGRDFSKPLSDCSILSLCGILPVWAQRYTTRFLSLHVRICVCGRSPFVPACVSIQVLLICNSGVIFFLLYLNTYYFLYLHTHHLDIWCDYPQQRLLHVRAEELSGAPAPFIRDLHDCTIDKKRTFV